MAKKLKLFTLGALSMALLGTGITMASPAPVLAETTPSADKYYYSQLPEFSQKFYNVMETMLETNMFKNGTHDGGTYNLENVVSQTELSAYANGSRDLPNAIYAARDAFCADNPDIFYVDFSNLSLKVTQNAQGKYLATLGAGRMDTYLNGFSDPAQLEIAVSSFDNAVNSIVQQTATLSSTREKIVAVHDHLVENVDYKLETDASPLAKNYVHTAYGALVLGESVCEGYSRAFKTIMDKLNIPCVLVQGLYSVSANQREGHMWNAVALEDGWYAVDVTMDDPLATQDISREYLLKTQNFMQKTHIEDGIMSASGFEFEYPTLNNEKLIYYYTYDNTQTQYITFSYGGMTLAEMAAKGLTIVAGQSPSKETDIAGYMTLEPYQFDPTLTEWTMYSYYKMQIAVVDNNPANFSNYNYTKSPSTFVDATPIIVSDFPGSRIPYLLSASPIDYQTIEVGKTHKVQLKYSEPLKKIDTPARDSTPLITITADTPSAELNAKIENIQWSESAPDTISFDFTPSKMYGDDMCNYELVLSGFIGATYNNAPRSVHFFACNKEVFNCPMADGINYKVYGKPVLLENKDLSMTDWTYVDGTPVSQDVSYRLSLVASKPSQADVTDMNNLLDDQNITPLASSTYNITLTLCQKQLADLPNGQKIKLLLPFPDGYGPNDAGVEFKAYHFLKNAQGAITGVEEISCHVNNFGLVVMCDSFSPFAVVAVSETGSQTQKGYIQTTQGGTAGIVVSGQAPTQEFALSDSNPSATVKIQADVGNVIECVLINGEVYDEATGRQTFNLPLAYGETLSKNNIVEVIFTTQQVFNRDLRDGQTPVVQNSTPQPDTPATSNLFIPILGIVGCTIMIGLSIAVIRKQKSLKE